MKFLAFTASVIVVCFASPRADTIFVDDTIGYSIYLPSNWVRHVVDKDHHSFFDSSYAYKSQLSIIRHAYGRTTYPWPEDWTRANFIAYKLCVQYSFNPFGAMLYYDTSAAVKQGTLRATESYVTFISKDTSIGSWAEYVRYSASSSYGYEIYAIGDTTDMMQNIGVYAALLTQATVPADPLTVRPARKNPSARYATLTPVSRGFVDPLGRLRGADKRDGTFPAGIYIPLENRRINIVAR